MYILFECTAWEFGIRLVTLEFLELYRRDSSSGDSLGLFAVGWLIPRSEELPRTFPLRTFLFGATASTDGVIPVRRQDAALFLHSYCF